MRYIFSFASASMLVIAACGDGSGSSGKEMDAETGKDEEPTDEEPTDEEPTDEEPTDEEPTDEEECVTTLLTTVRDFEASHEDFEYVVGTDPDIVEVDLGDDGKPTYAGDPTTATTTGVDNFDEWYNDTDASITFEVPIELQETEAQADGYSYANSSFFPIDDEGWGNEASAHNYHFTLELHAEFVYQGGEFFAFEGDDDVWVFINGRRGINLGGVHGPLEGHIDLDDMADEFGIEIGEAYAIDLFHAERHTTQSNFNITTTIACFMQP